VDDVEEEGRQSRGQVGEGISPGIFDQRTTVFTEVNSIYACDWWTART
jgi:hypothetical protein